ncbi:MAG: hypothetical protein ACRD10_01635 [Terriglobia bacterium]
MRVLVLDGNENQAVASVRSLSRAGHTVEVGSAASWSKAGLSRCSQGSFSYPSPEQSVRAFVSRLVEKTVERPGTLILPMTERTTLPLSAHRDQILAAGGRLVMPQHAAVVRAFDKRQTTDLARSLGLQVPKTVPVNSFEEARRVSAEFRYPAVLKPRTSEEVSPGGRVRATGAPVYAGNPTEFLDAYRLLLRRCASVLAQEFIEGWGAGYFALLAHGQLRAEFAHRRIRDVRPTGSGSALRVSVQPEAKVREAGRAMLGALKWHGAAMVEFRVRPDGTPVFMEVNGRFWNSLALAVYAGVDFPALLAELAERGDVKPVTSYRTGVRCRWWLGDFRHLIEVWRGKPAGYPGKFPPRLQALLRFLTPVPGAFHDNFELRDPAPEFGDWGHFLFRRLPGVLRRRPEQQTEAHA